MSISTLSNPPSLPSVHGDAVPASTAAAMRLVEPGDLRRSDLIASLSTALDLTEGQPPGHAGRSTLIAMEIGRTIGMSDEDLAALYYGVLLKDLGCSSNSAKMAYLFGADERRVKKDVKTVDWSKASRKASFAVKHVAPGGSPLEKAMRLALIAKEGENGSRSLIKTRCQRGAEIIRHLQLPEASARAVEALDEHWNGKGHPYGKAGEEIPLAGRIAGLAQTVEVFHQEFGRRPAVEIALKRRGRWFDPDLVDVIAALPRDADLWTRLESDDWREALDSQTPYESARHVDEDELDRVCEGFARVVDAKSPWTAKHSSRVAEISVGIGEELGLRGSMLRDLRRAGLLHDLGKLGVSNMILDKPGRPTDEEFAQIQMHPDYSEQILSRIPLFSRLTEAAVSHHEKLDGSGYHRRLDGTQMPPAARILAVADIYEALTADRPYRDGMPAEKVDAIMSGMVGPGLCGDCYEALGRWVERTSITSRVETQLEAIEQLHREL